jgi:hypothetical protein
MSTVLFYSNVHLGDLHLSRQYVQWFIDNIPDIKFYYIHNQHPDALCDIDMSLIKDDNFCYQLPQHSDILKITIEDKEAIAFNTWIGAGGLAVGCNFEAVHINFTKYFNYLIDKGIYVKTPILPKLPPKINFSSDSINKNATNTWFIENNKKTSVLIANNRVMSNQCYNENMNGYIYSLGLKFPHINFYITNQEQPLISLPNIFYIERIINNVSKFYMNDISYFSTFCDIIVGRGSGPFSFCEIVENLNKIWISFTFEHLKGDVFNGLQNFENNGRYIHTMNTNILPELLEKEFSYEQ